MKAPDMVAELRAVLRHLNDPAYLESCALAHSIDPAQGDVSWTRGQALRRRILAAIETLDPGAGVDPSAPAGRPYYLLRGCYVLRHSMGELSLQLNIGRRQVYRELRKALQALAHILTQTSSIETETTSQRVARIDQHPGVSSAEIRRVARSGHETVELCELLRGVIETASPLAAEHGLFLQADIVDGERLASSNRVVLRQAILSILSQVFREAKETVLVSLTDGDESTRVAVGYTEKGVFQPITGEQPYAMATTLLSTLGLVWEQTRSEAGHIEISLLIPRQNRHRVLVIDDNAGLIRLYERYLESVEVSLWGATSASDGLRALERVQPHVVILDVMMPDQDGWEVLAQIRQAQVVIHPKVVVCSIVDDPQLAQALGADAFLHKPVTRQAFVETLEGFLDTSP